jgi:hypothetical protein
LVEVGVVQGRIGLQPDVAGGQERGAWASGRAGPVTVRRTVARGQAQPVGVAEPVELRRFVRALSSAMAG